MANKTRRQFSREFKLQVIREIEAGKTVAQAAREHQLRPNCAPISSGVGKSSMVSTENAPLLGPAIATQSPLRLRSWNAKSAN